MLTDPLPRGAELRRQFAASDRQTTLVLPPAEGIRQATEALAGALAAGTTGPVKKAGEALLGELASFYGVSRPPLQVLGLRPHKTFDGQLAFELFGDYTPHSERIRVWMRTAVLGKVTSHRGLLNTLLHEFCHHLDIRQLGFEDTPHTRGFYARIDELYHLALGTPAGDRKPLVWRKRGTLWAIDWAAMRSRPRARQPR